MTTVASVFRPLLTRQQITHNYKIMKSAGCGLQPESFLFKKIKLFPSVAKF